VKRRPGEASPLPHRTEGFSICNVGNDDVIEDVRDRVKGMCLVDYDGLASMSRRLRTNMAAVLTTSGFISFALSDA